MIWRGILVGIGVFALGLPLVTFFMPMISLGTSEASPEMVGLGLYAAAVAAAGAYMLYHKSNLK